MLIVRLAKNHPLPDGNKRAAWGSEFVKIPGVHDGVAVARSTVAGKPALRVTYAQDGNRDNGTPFTVYSNTYVFVAHGTGMMLQFFRADESDRDFLATVGSILKSVKT